MTQANLFHTTGAVTVVDIHPVSDDARVSHKRLAAALGIGQHHKLRHLVERNAEEFQRYGVVPSTVDGTTAKGGRPGKLLWLNEGQAILAAVRSDAPHAPEVRYQVITAFMEYRRGKAGKLPTQVRAHERRTSVKVDKAVTLARSIDRLEQIAATLVPQPVIPNLCAMVVDGEAVFVDTTGYTGLKEDRAVVLRHDGTLGIEKVTSREGNNFFGLRSALGPSYKKGSVTHRNGVIVLGRIMGDTPTPSLTGNRKRDVTALLDAGKTVKETASIARVPLSTVYHWRRQVAA
ncbi:hypothetical protein ACXIUS_29695 [Bosea thiooxidans]